MAPRSDLLPPPNTSEREIAALRGLIAAITARLDAAEHYRRAVDEFEARVINLETRVAAAEGRIAELNLPAQTKALRDLNNQAVLDLQFTAKAMQSIRDLVGDVAAAVKPDAGGDINLSQLMSGNLSGLPPELAALVQGLGVKT